MLAFSARQALAQRTLLRPQTGQLLVVRGALGLSGGEGQARLGDGAVDGVEHPGHLVGDSGCRFALRPADHRTAGGLRRGIALLLALPLQRHDPGLRGADALTQRLDLEAGAHLALPSGLQRLEEPVARGRVEHRPRLGLGCLQLGLRTLGRRLGIGHGALHLGEPGLQALALGDRGLVSHRHPVHLLGVRGQGRVVLAERTQRVLRTAPRVLDGFGRALAGLAQFGDGLPHLGETLRGRVPFGRQLQS